MVVGAVQLTVLVAVLLTVVMVVLLTVVVMGAALPRELYLGSALAPFYCHIPTPSFIIIARV